MTGVCHHTQLFIFNWLRWAFAKFLPGLALTEILLISASQVARITSHCAWPKWYFNTQFNMKFKGTKIVVCAKACQSI
jgi:hypothetical protein